ncbi:MAG: 3-oxoadipate enol-lactonase [Betaproteobacteria bacterium]|nr:3-oxoadipate enol-lactonase [Betaproteobacteria bacterium]
MPWLEANGASLRYELGGSGKETLVLVHEAGGCLESYEDALPGLEKEFRVLRYDQRGFGFSEKVRELTFEMVVADLAALLDALKITAPVHVAGCAMGSDFSVGFAARHPKRVAKLALASPNIGHNAARSGPSVERAALVEREGIRSAMKASHDRSYPENLRALDRERFKRYQARWVCNTPASFSASARMMSTVDLTPEYAKIQAPTLVIGAKHDTQRPPETAQRVADAIRGAKYLLADTGHFMNVETPQLFVDTMVPFFKGR